MKFKKIRYGSLNSRQKEIYNFQKVAGILADYGYNCIKLADDWQGADFLAYNKSGRTLRVQLKSRLAIAKKYRGKGLYMAFRVGESWYLVAHDDLERLVGRNTTWLKSGSWRKKGGGYSTKAPGSSLLNKLKGFKIG